MTFRKADITLAIFLLATTVVAPAQTFTTLASFNLTNGALPRSPLVQGFDGNLYGTTYDGGNGGFGTVFKITPSGKLTTLHSFEATDGDSLYGGLVQGTDGNFYGTTSEGGTNCASLGLCGTIFKITSSGTLTTLYNFCAEPNCADGATSYAGLVQGTDGSFYGTTSYGGVYGWGTVFKITSGGTLTTLYSFCAQTYCADGQSPYAGLIQANDGNFYGMTTFGGTNFNCEDSEACGTIFKITPGGTLTTLHAFNSSDGGWPSGELVQANDGDFYGLTPLGGDLTCSYGCGTAFKITPGGTFTMLHSFDSTDGAVPTAGLVQAKNGNLYGTTSYGGAANKGSVFEIVLGVGSLTTLHTFGGTDGAHPYGGVDQATNGNFYGTTYVGGMRGDGSVFELSIGLTPFVETLPAVGKFGRRVVILGNNLTGATSVTFNGTPATFTVVSATEITTTVPTGATTGKVQVTSPTGTLTSNTIFRVK